MMPLQPTPPDAALNRPHESKTASPVADPPASVAPVRELPGKLAGMSLPRQVVMLAMWPFLEQILNFIVGFVDTALAGHISTPAAAAIAISAYIQWFLGLMQMAVGGGAAAVLSRAVGARHRGLANAVLGQAVLLAAIVGCVMGIIVYTGAPWIAQLVGDNPESVALCRQYLRILAFAGPFSAVLFVSNACLRASGDTRTPFVVLVVVNIVNTALSILLVLGPAPIGGHGVDGIAYGTLAAWIVGSAIVAGALLRGNGVIRLRLPRLRPHWHTVKRIFRIGIPNLFESGGMWFGNMLVVYIVTIVGSEAAIAAHGATIRLEAISFMPGFAMGMASATLVGQYLGLGDPKRAFQAAWLCAGIAVAVMTCLGMLFFLVPYFFARMVTNQPDLLELIPTLLWIAGPMQAPFAIALVLRESLRGAGDTRITMLITWFTTFCIRVPGAYLVGHTLGYGLAGIWVVLCYEWILRAALFGWRFMHRGWARVQV